MKYSLEELCLFSFVIRCFDGGQYSMSSTLVEDSSSSSGGESATPSASIEHSIRHIKNGTYSLSLTDTQIGAIGELNATLAGSTDNSKHLSDAMDDLAKVLYMRTMPMT